MLYNILGGCDMTLQEKIKKVHELNTAKEAKVAEQTKIQEEITALGNEADILLYIAADNTKDKSFGQLLDAETNRQIASEEASVAASTTKEE